MSPGGHPLGDNRFSLLSTSPKPKRKKTQNLINDNFPALPSTKKENPKYLVASATNSNRPLNKYSCFAVHKALKNISTEIVSISELRDGNLLLLVKNNNIAKKFISTTNLIGVCNVKIELHNNLNCTKGTIYAPCLNEVAESEIIENLSEQGVVSVFKFPKFVDGKSTPSGVVLLTFDMYNLPEKIDISWYTTKVRPYYANPMRCKNCQILGHTAKRCNKLPVCDSCALPPHSPQPCTRSCCVNCSGPHPASNRSCPKYTQMKEVIIIKTDKKCSMREAIKLHRMQNPPIFNSHSSTFSDVAKNLTNPQQQNPLNELTIPTQNNNQTNHAPNNLNESHKTTLAFNQTGFPNINEHNLQQQTSNINIQQHNTHVSTTHKIPSTVQTYRAHNNISNSETKENQEYDNNTMPSMLSVDDPTTSVMVSALLSHLSSPNNPTVFLNSLPTQDEMLE